jgi:hypothetical protein
MRTSDPTLRVRLEKAFNRIIDVDEKPLSSLDHSVIVWLGHIGGVDAKGFYRFVYVSWNALDTVVCIL